MRIRRWNFSLVAFAALQAFGPARAADASRNYRIDVSAPQPTYRATHLTIGGTNSLNESISANEFHLLIDGRPATVVTGEIHFWRLPRSEWREQLLKLKAGGVNVVATYVHWIVHEEHEGKFDWTGYRDLRGFIGICKELGLKVILRVGPFGHGEVRNGGFPDWLLGRPVTVRSNDPEYLRYVARYFDQIGEQTKGFFFSDGGPIIAVQVENEYQHSASPWGLTYPGQPYDWTAAPDDLSVTRQGVGTALGEKKSAETGIAHMRALLELIEKAGMKAPIYTATGWGNATIIPNTTLPVTGGYAYPSWEPKGTPSNLFLFTNLQRNPDYSPVSYAATDYPVISAEIGAGIQVTYTRRPWVPPQSTDAIVNRFLGSGANGIGYYMYQGGSSPHGDEVFYSDEAYGYPKISYDYQSPIGEYGDLRASYHRLKLIHRFLLAFGDRLAPLPVVLPDNSARMKADEVGELRYAARAANGSGFLFINNFQDHKKNRALRGVFTLATGNHELRIPLSGDMEVPAGESLILPVNFDVDGLTLQSATVQPLTRLNADGESHYVFFARDGIAPEYVFRPDVKVRVSGGGCSTATSSGQLSVRCPDKRISSFELSREGGPTIRILTLDHQSALDSWIVKLDGADRLVLSSSTVLVDRNDMMLSNIGERTMKLKVYPVLGRDLKPAGIARLKRSKGHLGFSQFEIDVPEFSPTFRSNWVAANKYSFELPKLALPDHVGDLWLKLTYRADTALAFQDGKLVADAFFFGQPWDIGLKRFMRSDGTNLLFYFRPLESGQSFMPDLLAAGIPEVPEGKRVIEVSGLTVTPEYRAHLTIE